MLGRCRRPLAPDALDQTVARDDLVRPQEEHREQRALLRTAEREVLRVPAHPHRAEDPELHREVANTRLRADCEVVCDVRRTPSRRHIDEGRNDVPQNTRSASLGGLACVLAVSSALAGQAGVTTKPGTNGSDRVQALRRRVTLDRGDLHRRFRRHSHAAGDQARTGVVDDQPDWSPDGSLITFHRCIRRRIMRDLHRQAGRLGRDAARARHGAGRLSRRLRGRRDPTFLPDGHHIVYTRATGEVKHFSNGTDQIQHSDIAVRDVGRLEPPRARPFARLPG